MFQVGVKVYVRQRLEGQLAGEYTGLVTCTEMFVESLPQFLCREIRRVRGRQEQIGVEVLSQLLILNGLPGTFRASMVATEMKKSGWKCA